MSSLGKSFVIVAIFLFFLFIPTAIAGQGCGKIKDRRFTLPSYRFVIVDKRGEQVPKLSGKGVVQTSHEKWTGTGFILIDVALDPVWETVQTDIPISIQYDPANK